MWQRWKGCGVHGSLGGRGDRDPLRTMNQIKRKKWYTTETGGKPPAQGFLHVHGNAMQHRLINQPTQRRRREQLPCFKLVYMDEGSIFLLQQREKSTRVWSWWGKEVSQKFNEEEWREKKATRHIFWITSLQN